VAQVDVVEYCSLASDGPGQKIAAGMEPARAIQQIPVGIASAQSAAFDSATRFVRVHTDTTIRIVFGSDPVASASSARMVANSTEFFGVIPGMKLAVIQAV
jgi:hypothetical protein